MKEYTYSDARQNLSNLLEQVVKDGEVRIRRRDGSLFVVKLEQAQTSPLDVPGIQSPIGISNLLESIYESREMR